MESREIMRMTEMYRPITMSSSLPVLSGSCGENVAWFNYAAEEEEEGIRVTVYNVYKKSGNREPEETKTEVSALVSMEECWEPELSYPEYMEALDVLQKDFSATKMQELLRRAVLAPLLPLYKKILEE